MNECTHCIHGFGQLCLILLTSYTKVTYDNYNTIGINETFINIFFNIHEYFTIIILGFHPSSTQLLNIIIIIIITIILT